MHGNKSGDRCADALNDAFARIEGTQDAIMRLLDAEAYDAALERSEAMLRLASTLPTYSNAATASEQTSRLEALIAAHAQITARLRVARDRLQTTKRQRHRAIDAYTKL